MISIHGAMLATAVDYGPAAYLALCAVAGLEPTEAGYGFLLVLDDDEQPCTAVTWDVDYVRLLMTAWGPDEGRGITVPAEKVIGYIREWPWMWVGFATWPSGTRPPAAG
ncbi:hypothetical protein ACFXEL_32905 [Streptomyces sp. NPDC059382]|uniref:hypothetical protein n=1 Tax=Streptomyces sp. NPDC059382 TaxID=3346816 RepID=UPI003679472D